MRGVLVVLAWASALVAPPRPAARRRCRPAAPEKAAEAPAEGLFRGPPELLTVRSEALLVAQAGLVGAATGVAVSGFKLGIDALEQASYGAYVRDAFLALPAGWSDDAAASALVYASVPALGGAAVGLLRAATPGFGDAANRTAPATALSRAGQESEIPNFKGSYLGSFPLVSADFWTSDHLSERSRSVDAFLGTRARGTLTLKRR